MAPTTVFRTSLQLALEASRGTAPTASQWYQGGRWFDIVTDGLPSIQNRQGTIFPAGHAGRRSMNQQPPVVGRRWSDGDFNANVTADWLGAVLKGAFGSVSSNSVPSTQHILLEGENLPADTETDYVLADQPSDGGAIIEIIILETSVAGSIGVSGINSHGEGASEVISFTSGGSYYTRNSFSEIGASGIRVHSTNQGSVNVYGYKYFEHTFSASDQDPTFSIARHGDPKTGAPSASMWMHPAMVLTSLGLQTAAADREGIFSAATSWEGEFGVTCVAASLNHASAMKIWPAWSLAVTRDSSNYHKVTNQTLDISTGNRNYRAAAGSQGPQGSFHGGREVTGTMDVLFDDASEYNRWQGASSMELVFDWTTPWKLTSDDKMQLLASMNSAYIEDMSESEDDDALSLSVDFRSIDDADTNVLKFKLVNGVPGTAYQD